MTPEERITELEAKLRGTLEILKTIVNLDRDFDNDTTEYLIDEINGML
jgi:hypothetical protein